MSDATVRQARLEDHEAVAAFTRDSWPDRDVGGWIADQFPEWVEGDGEQQRTAVAEVDGEVAGIAQCVLLSEHEAWCQGMRVHPEHRGRGVGSAVVADLFEWTRERGAVVVRNMVFSWNEAGLGQSRAIGFEPATEFRFVHPEPDADARPGTVAVEIWDDPAAAWSYWTDSDARDRLRGLALDDEESWALRELTYGWLDRAADEDDLFVAGGPEGTRGIALHTRTTERETDDGDRERIAEYGASAWDDLDAANALFDAIRADAADRGADRTRVLVPETVDFVSDAAACRIDIADEPEFVLAADLTGDE